MQTIRYPREQMHRIAYTKLNGLTLSYRFANDTRLNVAENDGRAVKEAPAERAERVS